MDKVIPTNGTSAEDIKYANTVKKVYIDGVDVSECEHYRAKLKYKLPFDDYTVEQDKCHYSGIEIIQDCKGNKGCIYKQLKRLETENERLKEEKQELSIEIVSLTSKLFTLEKSSNDLSQCANKLYKAIQKIKKYIAKICKEECGYVQKKRCPDYDCRFGVVLDLITKAEEENE